MRGTIENRLDHDSKHALKVRRTLHSIADGVTRPLQRVFKVLGNLLFDNCQFVSQAVEFGVQVLDDATSPPYQKLQILHVFL